MRTRPRTQSTRSQEMLQELFAEINDYLGDSPKPTQTRNEPTTTATTTTEYPIIDNNDEPPILLESDDEGEKHEIEASASYDDYDVCPITEDRPSVCICYKCNRERRRENNTPLYDPMDLPKERVTPTRSQSTIIDSRNGTSYGGISFGCIADRVKQTFGSSTDHKSGSTSTKNDKPARRWISRPKSLPSLKSTFGMADGGKASPQADIVMTTSTSTGYKQQHSSFHQQQQQQYEVPAEDRYQEQPAHVVMGSTGLHEQQLPFLTPSARTGNEHVVLRMAESRSIPRRQDRMVAYTNAYHDCIMARTNIIPWLTKQYSKGPPDAMFEYTPKPRKVGKSILSIFKRCAEKQQQQQQQHKQQQQHMQPISTYIVSTNTPSPLPQQQPSSSEPGLAYSSSSSSSNDTTPVSVLASSSNTTSNNNNSHISTSSGSSISIHHETTPSPSLYGNQTILNDPCSSSPSIMLAPSSSTGHPKEKQPVSILKKTRSSTSLPPPQTMEQDYPPRSRLLRARRHRSMYAPPPPPPPPPLPPHLMDDLYDQDDYYDGLDDEDDPRYYYRGYNRQSLPPPPPPVVAAMEYEEDGPYYDDSMDEEDEEEEEFYDDVDDPYYYNSSSSSRRRRMLSRTRPPPLTRMLPPPQPPMMPRRRSLYMDDPRRRFRSTRRVYR
ncbi:predicted protein [Lichtheimia corymbifera JMRC:FSU:9682]|uniref:Uncharacterized protein n=1 Tax=Lichtheimia corymbifera JMRC:FSU:9682 TaxID=1263082 RepID=A0A068S7U3_9FUNG|nr:predicted protein [Lichtheimia corymbifera JMRC:FSU:9682]